MTPDEFRSLYVGEWLPHAFEGYTPYELKCVERDKFRTHEQRRLAKRIRLAKAAR